MSLTPNRGCTDCKLHRNADVVCEMGSGPLDAEIMIVGKMPNSGRYQDSLESQLAEVGLSPERVYYTQALKCKNFEDNASNADVKACRQYLEREIATVKPTHILALGNEGLLATTGHSGITKYRGKPIDKGDFTVIPTVSPAAVNRNPGQRPGYMADLRLFANDYLGKTTGIKVPKFATIDTKKKLKALKAILEMTHTINFDVETTVNPLGEFDPGAKMISLAGTCLATITLEDGSKVEKIFGFALPLYHPESPWQRTWKAVLRFLKPVLEAIPKGIAQNGKFDCRWMKRFGVVMNHTFDTMLAIHLLNENIAKGLKPNCMSRLGVAPWGKDTKNLLNDPLHEVLEYNFLDTYYMYLLYKQLKDELKEQPRLLRILMKLYMPASRDLVDVERRGIWLDVDRMRKRKPQAEAKLKEIEDKLKEYLPPIDSDEWPMDSKGRKKLEVNFNASRFARWFLFDWLKLPVLERGKEKPNGDPGEPSMAESILLHLRQSTAHPAIQLMLDRVGWQKNLSSFFNAYEVMFDENHRVHTTFKLAGTVTGRLSSGKVDAEKVGGRTDLRGVNLQQVPRDPFIRGMFGAPPGWTFVEADYSQIELRIAAFIARERHMIALYQQGADIHMTTAMAVTGLPKSKVTKEIRKKVGKPVNFGFLYGMGFRKFIETAFNNYGAIFTEDEARAYRDAYFKLYPDLVRWHERQRRLVRDFGRVQSPLGRVRHLPDIYSPEKGVQAEAERQAINSPVQGFASDMALLSMTLINAEFRRQNIAGNCLGLVHDAINFEIRDDDLWRALPIIKDTMEDPGPLRHKFGTILDIPIVADLKIGRHWGDSKEIENAEVIYDPTELSLWMANNHPAYQHGSLVA
jgi:uracil-DNA glycosylase family 4